MVRDRRTGRLEEVSFQGEEEPIDPGDEGTTYVFRRGERVLSDHPVVVSKPRAFVETEQLALAERQ